MKKSLHLHQLIHSLNKGEKRYFKLFAATFEGKTKAYIKLFEAIDKQKSYDEKALKQKFAKESFVKYFAVAKNNLFNLILKSLRVYHSDKHVFQQLQNLKNDVFLLKDRDLAEIARLQLDKGSKLAEETNNFFDQILFAQWNLHFETHDYYLGNSNVDLEQLIEERLALCKQYLVCNQYVMINQKMYILLNRKGMRAKLVQEQLQVLFEHPLLQGSPPNHFIASMYYYHARCTYFHSKKNLTAYINDAKACLELFEGHPKRQQQEILSYFNTYTNYIGACLKIDDAPTLQKKLDRYLAALERNKREKFVQHDYERRKFDIQHYFISKHYIFNHQFEQAVTKLEKSLPILVKIQPLLTDFDAIKYKYLFAYSYFGKDDFKKAQHHTQELLNNPSLKKLPSKLLAVHLLNLLLHYEQKNYIHLDYLLKNTRQFFSRNDLLYEFENNSLKLLRQLTKVHYSETTKKHQLLEKYAAIFQKLKETNTPEQLDAFQNLDMLWWIKKQLAASDKKNYHKKELIHKAKNANL